MPGRRVADRGRETGRRRGGLEMEDWNLVVTVQSGGFKQAWELLQGFGPIAKTGYYNVIALLVADPVKFPEQLRLALERHPALGELLARVMPVEHAFVFQDPEEFERKACAAVAGWVGQLAGHSFHVRMHRRGFRQRMTSQHEEQFLDHWLVEQTQRAGQGARVTFDDPDYVVALETIGQRAGVSIWDRQARARFSFLKLD